MFMCPLGGCGEVAGAPETPASAKPTHEPADLGEVTDGEIQGGDSKANAAADSAAAKPSDAAATKPGGDQAKPGAAAAAPAGDEGSRDLNVISEMVKAQRQPVRDCYEKERKKNPKLQGKMVIHFVLDPEGKVTDIKLNEERSDIKEPDLVACAIKVIRGIKFPASSKGMVTEINYPYELMPQR
jgi:hypothetical protein